MGFCQNAINVDSTLLRCFCCPVMQHEQMHLVDFTSQRKHMLVFALPSWWLPYVWEDLDNGWEMGGRKGKIQETKKLHKSREFSQTRKSPLYR